MTFRCDDTTLDAFSVFSNKDIAKGLQADAENGLIRYLSDVSRLSIQLLCTEQLTERAVVQLHIPIIDGILPYREALAVVMIHSVLVLRPFTQNEFR